MNAPAPLPTVCRVERMAADVHVPVAIVGAGACGLSAALMLRDEGIDCVLLEREALPCGSTALSSGFVPAAGTAVQRAAGVHDTPEQFAADVQAKARGAAAPHLVEAYAKAAGPAIDALSGRHGIPFQLMDEFLYPGHSLHRIHSLPERTGAALVARLAQAAEDAGALLVCRALVRELWVDRSDRILGVGYVRPDGGVERIGCDALLLACNGFGGNPALVSELLPEIASAVYGGHPGNDGSALSWGRQLGARLADLGGYQGHGSWAVPHGGLATWALMIEGGVQINLHGARFHDESQGYSEAAVQVLAQPQGLAWTVFDEPVLQFARGFPDFVELETAGALKTCVDLPALAGTIGCPVGPLEATLAQVHPGASSSWGRKFERALQGPPWYAMKVTGALFHTQGGLDIDAECRVRRGDGSPFPNLLAAGGAARGVSGAAVWGYLAGNGLLSAIAGGYVAARTARRLIA